MLFGRQFLESGQHFHLLRKDYKEFLCLSIIFLGGSLPANTSFSIIAPGAISHARWRSKVIYSIKIALFSSTLLKHQLLNETTLENIKFLAFFLILYHVKPWFTSTDPTLTAVNDLDLHQTLQDDLALLKTLSSKQQQMKPMLNAYLKKLDCHLWYLSERLAVLSLFASCIPNTDKKAMAKALVKYRKSKNSKLSMQQMPVLKTKTKF